MIDRPLFFKTIRPLFKPLSQDQVDGLNHLLDVWESDYSAYPLVFLAYALATTYHETAKTMQPIREYGKGKGRKYGVPVNGRVYYGRGYVQLTWDSNYRSAGTKLGIDLLGNPDLALDPVIAAKVMFTGMIEGWFTGKTLAQFFTAEQSQPVGARRIINGTDKADLIAGYHKQFLAALREAPEFVQPIPATPVATTTSTRPTGLLGALLALFRKA